MKVRVSIMPRDNRVVLPVRNFLSFVENYYFSFIQNSDSSFMIKRNMFITTSREAIYDRHRISTVQIVHEDRIGCAIEIIRLPKDSQ